MRQPRHPRASLPATVAGHPARDARGPERLEERRVAWHIPGMSLAQGWWR
jgi:hypothetical protein